jgi:WS/DGAT/MGAT family acyltransferase
MSTVTEIWGDGRDTMNAFEVLMWRGETASMLRSTCVALEILETTPTWPDLLAAHERVIRTVPRLRQRVVEAPLGLAAPRWTEDPNFDLHFHLRRMRLPEGSGYDELFATAEQIGMSAFDRARPLWESTLVEGLPDGRSAYVFKVHHAISDGLGFMQMLTHFHAPTRGAGYLPPYDPAPTIGSFGALAADARDRVEAAPRHVRKLGSLAARALRAPLPAVRDGIAYGASLRRVFSPPQATPSPLLADRSANWRFAALDVDFDALRRASKAVGASLNDAYISALMGGYRRYHEAMGLPVGPIPVAIPISLRAAEEAAGGGNQIASARLAGPIDVEDPAARMAIIGDQVRAARDEPAMNNLNLLGPALAKLPAAALASVIGNMTKANDLQASNVPGARQEVYLAGARVERMYGYGPLPGCPAMITLVTHGQIACVGVNYDAAAFTDGTLFTESLCAGFDEVLALGGPDYPPTTHR